MEEQNKNTSLVRRETSSLVRVSKQIEVTNKLLKKINQLPETSETVTDIDGNIYHTVKIGTQVWMVENLNVSHFRNGDIITEVKIAEKWKEASCSWPEEGDRPDWCYYDNNPEYGKIYGKLYNWYAINDHRKICPIGWHVPSNAEWTTLITYLGGEGVAGKMKEAGTTHWSSPNTGAVNSSGFTALPGGYRDDYGVFRNVGNGGFWWSVSEDYANDNYAWNRSLGSDSTYVSCGGHYCGIIDKAHGFSVRCLRDY